MMTKDKLRQLTGDERLGQMRESEYLGAEDIDDGTEPVLTIAGLWYGSVTLQRGKENKDVLSFKEERVPGILQVRPLIVNSTNRKTLRKLFGDAKGKTLIGWRLIRPRTTVCPYAQPVPRSARKPRPLQKCSRRPKTLRKCSRTARLRISRWILTPGRCCNGPSCCHSGELLLS